METTSKPAITIERAAELSGSSKRNIQRAKPIVTTGIPAITEGLPRSKAAPIVKARMHELQTKFSDSSSEFWKSHPEKD